MHGSRRWLPPREPDQRCRFIFCGDHLLAAKLTLDNIDASAGATEEVSRIVEHVAPAGRA
jgi:hypothetical protein